MCLLLRGLEVSPGSVLCVDIYFCCYLVCCLLHFERAGYGAFFGCGFGSSKMGG